jgi:hypothetical protein
MQSQRSVHGLDLSAGAGAKVFWFFSSEKNALPYQDADFTWFLPGQTLTPMGLQPGNFAARPPQNE